MGPLETFGSKVVVGWRFRFWYVGIFARRRRIDRPLEVSSMLKHLGLKVSLPPPYLYRNDFSQSNIRTRYGTAVDSKSDLNHTEICYDVEITVTLLSHPVPNTHVVGIYRSKLVEFHK